MSGLERLAARAGLRRVGGGQTWGPCPGCRAERVGDAGPVVLTAEEVSGPMIGLATWSCRGCGLTGGASSLSSLAEERATPWGRGR